MHLTKHHGLGNDFLVLLDPIASAPVSAELVRRVCDRHRGVGADGLLRAVRPTSRAGGGPEVDATMELFNADGGRAEMSGNGIRCLAQALLLDGWATPPDVVIATDAGVRVVVLHEQVDPATQLLSVDMGPARLDGEAPEWVGGALRRAAWADVGNPHLVVEVDSPTVLDLEQLVTLGEKVNASVASGANVHLVARPSEGSTLRVRSYERGVGPTEACGTGACAVAAVARGWGLVGDRVVVEAPGGSAEVELGESVRLRGPAASVAAVEVPYPGQA
jgi:diaminopimelate epimerase